MYDVGGHNFHIQEQPMHENLNFSHAGADQVGLADSFSTVAQSARLAALAGQADSPSRLS